jgi:hypothetical protein
MNHRMALQRLDFERRTIPDLDVNLETTPHVVRAISKLGFWNGIVYSHFPGSVAEDVIAKRAQLLCHSSPELRMEGV